MKTITTEKYIEGVDSIYVEQPGYRTGGDGSDGTCDCIGMPRGALERQGVKDVTNMRGTNQAARKTIQDLHKIGSVNELQIGMVVLKVRDKDDKDMPLPDRYRKGGSEYSSKWGETNFTHIGTVTGVNPLEITHMTSPTAKKDTSLGRWEYAGWLPWVEREQEDEDPPWDEDQQIAVVVADSDSTVKMRAKPSTSCKLYWDVPIGSTVIVDEAGSPWCGIKWDGRMGYMMTKFLQFEESPPLPGMYTVTIQNLTKEQAEELCREWGNATMAAG